MGLYNTFQTNAISNMLIFKCKTIDFEFTLSENAYYSNFLFLYKMLEKEPNIYPRTK